MKVSYLHIRNYKQFSDLELDLTYPKGHPKAGKPLDKICIIGQSGTGKTNLLEIIREKLYTTEVKTTFIEDKNSNSEKIYFSRVEKYSEEILENQNNIEFSQGDKRLLEDLEERKHRLVFEKIESIPKDKDTPSLSIAQRSLSIVQQFQQAQKIMDQIHGSRKESFIDKKYRLLNTEIEKIKDKYVKKELVPNYNGVVIELNENSWKILKEKIENYNIERLKYRDKLSNKLLNITDYSKDDFKREIKEWENQNDNILESISDKLNSILVGFNLKLHKIDENQTAYNDLTIEDLSNGNIIEYQYLSTGTKNLIATFIPLKIYKPQDSIILIDEPEMSFYPNIQRQLTDLYMEVGENNQLIMATHSPLIASSFEPWEVVELKFDRDNQIYREKYYEGDDNHVGNYTVDPRMLTWTGILTDVFDLQEDSNFSFREKKLMEYATLKAEIKAMESIEEKEEKFKELKKISKILGLDN